MAAAAAGGGATPEAAVSKLIDALRATKDAGTCLDGGCIDLTALACSRGARARRLSRAGPTQRACFDRQAPLPLRTRPSLAGLRAFRRHLRGRDAAPLLRGYLARSPAWQELHAVWDAQAAAKSPAAALELLQLLHDLLRYAPPSPGDAAGDDAGDDGDDGDTGGVAGGWRGALSAAQDALARSILQRRLKALYFNLSSGGRMGQ